MSYSIVPGTGSYFEEQRMNWRPKLRPGHFYIKDRLYYLFANKRTVTARDLRELRWELVGAPVAGTGSLQLEGVPWTNYHVEGRTLVVKLLGLEGDADYWANLGWDEAQWNEFKNAIETLPDNAVDFTYMYNTWNSGTHEYDSGTLTEKLYTRDSETEHHLPNDYVPGTPIVITDDTKELWDARDHQLQFHSSEPRRSVYFNMYANLLGNPHFAMAMSGASGTPAKWYPTDPMGVQRMLGSGYVGTGYMQIDGTGKLVQDVLVPGGHPVVVEAWARTANGPVTGYLELAFKQPGSGHPLVDTTGGFLSYEPDFTTYSVRQSGSVGSEWTRISIVLGTGNEFDPADALYPDICDRMEVRCHGSGTIFGAVQLKQGALRAGQYNYVDDKATVEYETDGSGFYRFRPSGAYPYPHTWDADMNPVNREKTAGFLSITEDGDPIDEALGIGELTWESPAVYGTGYPQGVKPWPSGVRHVFGRRHLPYAKMRGHQKLRHTQVFDLENQPPSLWESTEPRRSRYPVGMQVSSASNLYHGAVDEIVLGMRCIDHSGHMNDIITNTLVDVYGNPIVNDWVTVASSGQIQVDPSGAYTNEGGTILVRVGPLDDADTAPNPSGQIDFVHYKSGFSGFIRTSMDELPLP